MNDFDINAYESPQFPAGRPDDPKYKAAAKGRLQVPAILLIVLATLGALMSTFNAIGALVMEPPSDPGVPELIRSFQQNTVGPLAAAAQAFFLALNLFIIYGALCMWKVKSYPLAMAACIAAAVNIGTCCCLPSLPVAIWALVLLSNDDIKRAFYSTQG